MGALLASNLSHQGVANLDPTMRGYSKNQPEEAREPFTREIYSICMETVSCLNTISSLGAGIGLQMSICMGWGGVLCEQTGAAALVCEQT